ncbi:hypothetical protein [Algoriphagus boritolerans]|uniref:hypothetical protein n=1 Tax=Algoriphagus boritolerans TaxID=308111 RepID=UPI000AA4031C
MLFFEAQVQLVNKTDSPIDSIHFNSTDLTNFKVILDEDTLAYRFPLEYKPRKFQLFGKKPEREWYKITALPETMMPGDTLNFVIISEKKQLLAFQIPVMDRSLSIMAHSTAEGCLILGILQVLK